MLFRWESRPSQSLDTRHNPDTFVPCDFCSENKSLRHVSLDHFAVRFENYYPYHSLSFVWLFHLTQFPHVRNDRHVHLTCDSVVQSQDEEQINHSSYIFARQDLENIWQSASLMFIFMLYLLLFECFWTPSMNSVSLERPSIKRAMSSCWLEWWLSLQRRHNWEYGEHAFKVCQYHIVRFCTAEALATNVRWHSTDCIPNISQNDCRRSWSNLFIVHLLINDAILAKKWDDVQQSHTCAVTFTPYTSRRQRWLQSSVRYVSLSYDAGDLSLYISASRSVSWKLSYLRLLLMWRYAISRPTTSYHI